MHKPCTSFFLIICQEKPVSTLLSPFPPLFHYDREIFLLRKLSKVTLVDVNVSTFGVARRGDNKYEETATQTRGKGIERKFCHYRNILFSHFNINNGSENFQIASSWKIISIIIVIIVVDFIEINFQFLAFWNYFSSPRLYQASLAATAADLTILLWSSSAGSSPWMTSFLYGTRVNSG